MPFSFLAFLYKSTGSCCCPTLLLALTWVLASHLKFHFKILLCNGQGSVRGAVLYADMSCCLPSQLGSTLKSQELLLLQQIL